MKVKHLGVDCLLVPDLRRMIRKLAHVHIMLSQHNFVIQYNILISTDIYTIFNLTRIYLNTVHGWQIQCVCDPSKDCYQSHLVFTIPQWFLMLVVTDTSAGKCHQDDSYNLNNILFSCESDSRIANVS